MIQKLNDFNPDKDPEATGYQRPHDTWNETRIYSADLDEDALVAVRRLSLRAKRRIVTLALTAFTIGALLIVFNSPFRNDMIAAGPLCSSHAQILAGEGPNRCAACHSAGDDSFASWISNTLTGQTAVGKTQSQLCMDCHQKSLVAEVCHQAAQRRSRNFVAKNKSSGRGDAR